MIRTLEWLLGLKRIHLGADAPLSIRFTTPPPPWIMLIGAVLTGSIVFYLYRREAARGIWRWLLSALRMATIMSILLLFSRPVLILRHSRIEPSVVALLLDRSASMSVVDPPIKTGSAKPLAMKSTNRWSSVTTALLDSHRGLIKALLPRQQISLWGFGKSISHMDSISTAKDIQRVAPALRAIHADDSQTDIAGAVASVLARTQAVRLAGILIFSDGRQTISPSLDLAMDRTQARSIPLHVIAVGSPRPRRDIAVTSAWSEDDVFVYDTVEIHVKLEIKGFDEPTPITLELRDNATDEVISYETDVLSRDQISWEGDLHYRPTDVGRKVLRVVVPPLQDEENTENNSADLAIRAHDDKISVLYVDNIPRYEYRYLKNLLLRESTLESSCLLLEAGAGFTQEGSRPIRHFPRSIEELGQYDVVILGDVDPHRDWLSPSQAAMLVDFVSNQGGGLALIAGERNMPQRLRRTRLEKLLPIKIDPEFYGQYQGTLVQPFSLKLTREGRDSSIFRFESDRRRNQSLLASLPGWFWFATVRGPKPAAIVLAVHPSIQTPDGPLPIAVLGRFGAGRTFYLGSDDMWRWRQYTGEHYYENIWLKIIRTLARGHKLGTHRRWRIQTDRKHYALGQQVHIEVFSNKASRGAHANELHLGARDEFGDLAARVLVRKSTLREDTFRGEFTPHHAGIYSLSLDMPIRPSPSRATQRTITVEDRDLEHGRLEADPMFLKRLAEQSGGTIHRVGDDLRSLAERLPDRSIQIPDDVEEPLWDTRLLFALIFSLILTEWIIRKAVGLA